MIRRASVYKTDALPTELRWQSFCPFVREPICQPTQFPQQNPLMVFAHPDVIGLATPSPVAPALMKNLNVRAFPLKIPTVPVPGIGALVWKTTWRGDHVLHDPQAQTKRAARFLHRLTVDTTAAVVNIILQMVRSVGHDPTT